MRDDVYLTPDGKLFKIKKSIFGRVKTIVELSPNTHVYHRDVGLYDKDGVLVYEGDFVEAQVAEDRIVQGLVAYVSELSSYVILCIGSEDDLTGEYFALGSQVSEYIQVIGNVFESMEKKG